ncbi:MAG: peptidoglycan-binding protein [Actinomycetia bacterium]|nr:peptidoglycan-binding protein [Actinomycetes bacterium]
MIVSLLGMRRRVVASAAAVVCLGGLAAGLAPAAHAATVEGARSYAPVGAAAFTCGYYSGNALTVRGDLGPRVREVQCLLGITVDGQFGPITESTVRQFQSWYGHGLAVDGKVGVHTWAALREVAGGIHG